MSKTTKGSWSIGGTIDSRPSSSLGGTQAAGGSTLEKSEVRALLRLIAGAGPPALAKPLPALIRQEFSPVRIVCKNLNCSIRHTLIVSGGDKGINSTLSPTLTPTRIIVSSSEFTQSIHNSTFMNIHMCIISHSHRMDNIISSPHGEVRVSLKPRPRIT